MPSVSFSEGDTEDVPYKRLLLFAVLGVLASIVFFSMLAKPHFYARLMGAKTTEYTASSDGLVRVAAESPLSGVVTPTRPPSVSIVPTYIPTGVVLTKTPTPKLSVTVLPAQGQVLKSRLEVNTGGVAISSWSFEMYYTCYSSGGYPSVAGSFIYKSIGTVENVANVPVDSVCRMQLTKAPNVPLGYVWSEPSYQTATGIDASGKRYHVVFNDIKVVRVASASLTPTKPVTITPIISITKVVTMPPTSTPTPSTLKTYYLAPQAPYVAGGTGKVTLYKPAAPTGYTTYRIVGSSFTGLVPGRQYDVWVCGSGSCSGQSNTRVTAAANGTASWVGSTDITVRNVYPATTIQIRQYLLPGPVPTYPPSCGSTACMSAAL